MGKQEFVVCAYDFLNPYDQNIYYCGKYIFQGEEYAILDKKSEAKIYKQSTKQMEKIVERLNRRISNVNAKFKFEEKII